MSEPVYFPGLSEDDAKRPLNVARIVNNILSGSLNVTRNITIDNAAPGSVVVQDPRIHPGSYLQFMAIGTGTPPTISVNVVGEGQATIKWSGGSAGTWTVRMLIIG